MIEEPEEKIKHLDREFDFDDYFDLSDELWVYDFGPPVPALTLADFEEDHVTGVFLWAKANGAPWPPFLPWAEEKYLRDTELEDRKARMGEQK
jgi:hypothetical protein